MSHGDEQPPIDLNEFIAELSEDPEREPVASELGVLQSIYGTEAIKMWGEKQKLDGSVDNGTIRYEVTLNLPEPNEEASFSVLVSVPATYPANSAPQLQLLSRYIGPFGVDSVLFGAVLRTFISSEGVEWVPDSVCVFDGLELVKERCSEWFGQKKSEKLAGELLREDERGPPVGLDGALEVGKDKKKITQLEDHVDTPAPLLPVGIPDGIDIVEAEPITDRKSAFVGRACKITDPAQVPLILSHLMSDRRIARAAHPIINAWRCQVGGVVHQDNDDDGETAAGGRLAHLLQILEVNDVLVVVTRYWGGIHLGPDRFKHINQSARNALELGGFLDTGDTAGKKRPVGRGKKR
ncbi:ribosomal protein S5 domain 2-type protein [Cristinia sonorae]|uniref:Ribosomal protein S5 domain 2-type protein n=1 Tax=Cristinia sonorae TaxID=1940300 RepID=A0A8K0XN62_9AGAR|nr:ribosomal protein S5 domain 2-type protein [Cristinia sonorae]